IPCFPERRRCAKWEKPHVTALNMPSLDAMVRTPAQHRSAPAENVPSQKQVSTRCACGTDGGMLLLRSRQASAVIAAPAAEDETIRMPDIRECFPPAVSFSGAGVLLSL